MPSAKQANLTIDRKFAEKWDKFTDYCKKNAINRNALIRKMIEEWMNTLERKKENVYVESKEKYKPTNLDQPRNWYP
ncbi:MAG: hypothetical protein BEU04_01900 [Marine Group III euryarchaeote CG-Bathy1]|uniref:Ribbon-helix-helix protein CopG domain-containing protein n=1 Tax=Marine Group III euryarchaeote CG-Bathy1 TaxID=1889001 RepID=A0A1J5TPP6_9ARCH|nr:MAG: hypothetical protein BEU04_01900 [Marine Group III euryarchaeote CG-Bathy1]